MGKQMQKVTTYCQDLRGKETDRSCQKLWLCLLRAEHTVDLGVKEHNFTNKLKATLALKRLPSTWMR